MAANIYSGFTQPNPYATPTPPPPKVEPTPSTGQDTSIPELGGIGQGMLSPFGQATTQKVGQFGQSLYGVGSTNWNKLNGGSTYNNPYGGSFDLFNPSLYKSGTLPEWLNRSNVIGSPFSFSPNNYNFHLANTNQPGLTRNAQGMTSFDQLASYLASNGYLNNETLLRLMSSMGQSSVNNRPPTNIGLRSAIPLG